ncbi:Histidine phosphatase superfamily, clade-1 [Corchorus olitorius]|uniref:Histidine phosphatase superfamily, clade-1 n=1 Tax=Corchorus olitorius TaxID=93759 RepID=A0A1R3K0R9_9ROSI|nr:Histidine phosphatase superfamily, clade-1 [Corchorus olitorius]
MPLTLGTRFIAPFPTPISIRVKNRDGRNSLLHRKTLVLIRATAMDSSETKPYYQNVVVMRHGDRMDNFDPTWKIKAERPWDPPLIDNGLARAFRTGLTLRDQLGFPIHRVFVSPFLRCVQTASEVVAALCSVGNNPNAKTSRDVVSSDPSKVKVSIEYGLCEMLNKETIRLDVAPKDGIFRFDIPKLEALLSTGTVDHTFERVYKEVPKWEETVMGTRSRYQNIVKALADKYPSENLLLVTHGEGVGVSVSGFLEDKTVVEVDYCAYSELKRPISFKNDSFTAGNFEVLTKSGQTGVTYFDNHQLVD